MSDAGRSLIEARCAECGMALSTVAVYHPHAFCVLYKAGYRDPWVVIREAAYVGGLTTKEATRTEVLEQAVRHVLRFGKLGKNSGARLKAALGAVELSRG